MAGRGRAYRAFILLCVLSLSGATAYLVVRATQSHALDAPRPPAASQERLQTILARPHVVFLDTPDFGHRHLATAPPDDSYGAPFSTRTELFDLRSGQDVGDLEGFVVYRDGAREGDLGRRDLRTLRENVECPSLSPDGRHIAFKQAIAGRMGEWRLAVLDLRTMDSVLLDEERSVDDQVAWLNDDTVLYAVSEVRTPGELTSDIWTARLDRSEPPRVFLRDALSPAVVWP